MLTVNGAIDRRSLKAWLAGIGNVKTSDFDQSQALDLIRNEGNPEKTGFSLKIEEFVERLTL